MRVRVLVEVLSAATLLPAPEEFDGASAAADALGLFEEEALGAMLVSAALPALGVTAPAALWLPLGIAIPGMVE